MASVDSNTSKQDLYALSYHTLCNRRSFETTTRMEILCIRKCCRSKQLCMTVTKHTKIVLLLLTTNVLSKRLNRQLHWEARNPMVGRREGFKESSCLLLHPVDTCAYVPLRSVLLERNAPGLTQLHSELRKVFHLDDSLARLLGHV
jgi:hypothetical protein